MEFITSKNSKIVKDLVKLRNDTKFQNDKSLFYVEGKKIIFDIPKDLIKSVFIAESKKDEYIDYFIDTDKTNIYVLTDNVYDKVKDTVNSQGIVAIVKYDIIKNINELDLKKINNVIILDSVSDPGNLGTILRISEATGIDLIILINNCCSIFNPKVIRSSMSSLFRVNIHVTSSYNDLINLLKENNFNIYSTTLSDNSISYSNIDFKNKNVIIYGNEANGVSKDLIDISDKLIKIPMRGSIESLNVSVSVGIISYEIMRQNKL